MSGFVSFLHILLSLDEWTSCRRVTVRRRHMTSRDRRRRRRVGVKSTLRAAAPGTLRTSSHAA